jgi:hypothetical protein
VDWWKAGGDDIGLGLNRGDDWKGVADPVVGLHDGLMVGESSWTALSREG